MTTLEAPLITTNSPPSSPRSERLTDERITNIITTFDHLGLSLGRMSRNKLNLLLQAVSSQYNPHNSHVITAIVHSILQHMRKEETFSPIIERQETPTEPTTSLRKRVSKIISENPAKLLFCATLALQVIEAPILDKLIQDVLSIQILYTSTFTSSTSSLVLPDTLIKFSVLEVCITLTQIISSMVLFRKFSLNMRNKEFDSAIELAKNQGSLREIKKYSNQPPVYIWHFLTYAVSAMTLLITSSTILATVLSKMQSGVVLKTSSGLGSDNQVMMGIIVNETMVRCFGALSIFSLKHVILSACGIFKLWENKFEVTQGMRTADAVTRFV